MLLAVVASVLAPSVLAAPLLDSPSWSATSGSPASGFGCVVASAGDVNADGYDDIVVGAQSWGTVGRALLYLGGAEGPAAEPAWWVESDEADSYFGYSVAGAGDVNGDGYADVVVGAYDYDDVEHDEGKVWVYLGSPAGLPATADWSFEPDQEGAHLGWSVSSAGDVNGDGYGDLLVGAPRYTDATAAEGRIYVFLGGAGGLAPEPAWTAESGQEQTHFGLAVAPAGDVNGDGYADVIAGGFTYDDGETDEGGAFVYLGSPDGPGATWAWHGQPDLGGAFYGYAVATAGDVNGDGFGDVVVGAPDYTDPDSNEGRAFLYLGSAAGLSVDPDWGQEGEQLGAWYGRSVGSAGDLDADGYGDLVVGANRYTDGVGEGGVFVYRGTPDGPETTASWSVVGDQVGSNFGLWVGTAGDANGDGQDDLVVGALTWSGKVESEGKVWLYEGVCGDADGDGVACDADCDDGDPGVYPGASDTADDGIDQDCDGADATVGSGETGDTADTGGPGDTAGPGETGDSGAADSADSADSGVADSGGDPGGKPGCGCATERTSALPALLPALLALGAAAHRRR